MSNQAELDRQLAKIATDYRKLNVSQQEYAIKEIGRVRLEVVDLLSEYSGSDGKIKKQRLNKLLRELDAIEKMIRNNGMDALEKVIGDTASNTTGVIKSAFTETAGVAAISGVAFDKINKNVLRYVVNRFGDDDLVLSDRVWRLAGDQRDELSKVIRTGIITGQSVNKISANVRKVYENEAWKVRRLVVTEGNTAHRVAAAYTGQQSRVVKAMRVHRGKANRPDHRCTQLELLDRYGMGAGLYKPDDPEIYMMHINCTGYLSYELYDKFK
ncbi:hypothetical protein [Bacillus atrophaeus]|uniref:hypothetical protein n=1 Tax=Bacillus atrophaeus TaxID=1452 RepID=UPI002E1EAF32|nr:hypothetical protein [Bacillus atrophaeus]